MFGLREFVAIEGSPINKAIKNEEMSFQQSTAAKINTPAIIDK